MAMTWWPFAGSLGRVFETATQGVTNLGQKDAIAGEGETASNAALGKCVGVGAWMLDLGEWMF